MVPKALIVDDNYFNRDLCKLALDAAGYEYKEASNGVEAVENLSTQTFDVLLLDLSMPDMSGIRVIGELKKMSGHDDLCVMVVTANPHMATPEVEDAADYVFCKPIDIQLLALILRRIKEQRVNEPYART